MLNSQQNNKRYFLPANVSPETGMNIAELYFTILFLFWSTLFILSTAVTRCDSQKLSELPPEKLRNRIYMKSFLAFASGIAAITLAVILLPQPPHPTTTASTAVFLAAVFFLLFLASYDYPEISEHERRRRMEKKKQ